MKKLYVLTVCVLVCLTCAAQYGAWKDGYVYPNGDLNAPNPTYVGPLNFMTLDVPNYPYVRLTYNESYSVNEYESTSAFGPNNHHQLRTTDGPDPCRCINFGSNSTHENYFPVPTIITKPDGSPVDTVIQLGSTSLNNNTQIEYWFYPQENESVLLVCFSFAAENVSHDATINPRFYIEVLDAQTNQLIQSGYYPTEAAFNAGPPYTVTNPNWPYSRFLAVPSGNQSAQDHMSYGTDWYGNINYYWAHPEATPTTFPYRICPYAPSTSWDVIWFEYTPLAFDLSDYAAQGKSVKLRIRNRSCEYFAHWSYGLFYAKMVSGGGTVAATDDNPVFHLSVPTGFMENSYEWHYGYDYTDALTRPELDIFYTPGITASSPYDILIDQNSVNHLWPYYCCTMLSYTGVPFVFEYYLRKYHLDADFTYEQDGDSVHFQDASTVYYQTPATLAGGGWDTVYDDTHFLRWYVKQNGAFTLFAENESSPSYTFTPATVSNGQATVMLVISDNQRQVYDTVVKTFPMSLSDVPAREREAATVMPNPTSGSVRVSADQDIQSIRILNADGKLLNTVTVQDKAATLDLGRYEGSLFLLDIRFQDGTSTVKKVVRR